MQRSVLVFAALLWCGVVLGQYPNRATPPPRNPTPQPGPQSPGGPHSSSTPGPAVSQTNGVFLPAASQPGDWPVHLAPTEPLALFDSRQADVQWTGTHWKLLAGPIPIKDLDKREPEAREAARLVRELHLTQYGAIGTPRPVMEYWLSNGQAPTARTAGLRFVSFDPIALKAECLQGQWCLRDARRIYFNFGSYPEDARRALEVIRRHGFNQVGYVGQPVPIMIYFLAGTNPGAPGTLTGQAGGSSTPAPKLLPPGVQDSKAPPVTVPPPGTPRATTVTTSLPHLPTGSITVLPDQAAKAERVPIDWRQVQVRRDNQEWKLFSGKNVLANFGTNERDAQQALAVMRHYRLTEQCLIGKPQPAFTYYLTNGQVPRGTMIGVRAVSFRPHELTVQRVGASYILTDGLQTLLNFGDRPEEARETLQVIQRHQCDRLCHIGSADTGLRLLVRTN